MSNFFILLDSLEVDRSIRSDGTDMQQRYQKGHNQQSVIIKKLIGSANVYQRTIGYRLAGFYFDTTFADILRSKMFSEDTLPAVWAYSSLTQLDKKATDAAFSWLVKYEDFGDAVSMGWYLLMDTNSIISTGYKHLEDENNRAQILSLQTIALFDKTIKADSVLRAAVLNWDERIKGYAIAALEFNNKGNYKSLLQPYTNNQDYCPTIRRVLERSPTKQDNEFAKHVCN